MLAVETIAVLLHGPFCLSSVYKACIPGGRGERGAGMCCREKPQALETEMVMNLSSATH